MKRTVDLIAQLRRMAGCYRDDELIAPLLAEAADRLETFAWDGLPPRTPHLAADWSPDAGDVDAGASPPTRHADRPSASTVARRDGGEVRLGTAPMPLAAEFSEPDPCPVHGLPRPVPRLTVVPF